MAYHHLLVPLDGSALAETAIPYAVCLAKALQAKITLVHIIEKDVPETVHGQAHLQSAAEAETYLLRIANDIITQDVLVERHVHSESASHTAEGIAEHTLELSPDLIVMCSHGNGGVRDFVAGSIAQQVIHISRIPVLLVRSQIHTQICFNKIMVALDSDPQHARSLAAGGQLAQVLGASLHLLSVINTLDSLSGKRAATGRLLPGTTAAMLDISETYTAEWLKQQARPWLERGLKVRLEVSRGDVVKQIAESAQREKADLIVLGTHGKVGLDAFWTGSIAPRVAARCSLPLLLVPVHH